MKNLLAKRIIPCLDVKDGRVVKGVNFVGLRDAGDPVELAKFYSQEGADEIVFLDITATSDNRDTIADVVRRTCREVFVPVTVGGGIRTVDARANAEMPSGFEVYVAGGRTPTGKDAVAWAKEVYERGAGEILLTSMDKDGTKSGFDLKLTKAVVEVVGIPVIASGGCGSLEHFSEVFEKTGCDAALAASLFHYRELTVGEVKEHLKEKKIPVRK